MPNFEEIVTQTTEKIMSERLADFVFEESPLLKMISKPKPLTRWQLIKLNIRYRLRMFRERLGEIVAGREFDNGDF